MLGQVDDLSAVVSVVSKGAVEGLQYCMWFMANSHGVHQMFGRERVDCGKDDFPAISPPAHDVRTSGSGRKFKLLVTMAIGLLTVGGQEVGEAGAHVSGNVLHDRGNGI